MGSGQYPASGVRATWLCGPAITELARQAAAVAGVPEHRADPREIAVCMGYRVLRAESLPGGATSAIIDRAVLYTISDDPLETLRRVAMPVAALVLEAFGHSADQAEELCSAMIMTA